jgi:asparagine synthase (glutamine-hydrolysing)
MCGIVGIISRNRNENIEFLVKNMADSIVHRGPDGVGYWTSECERVSLGHRRLSILDLSVQGKQPMHYLDRYTITFNGEIYNYIELRDLLEKKGYKFKSSTDTEVLLALYDLKKEECLNDLDGMFAFAIWDNVKETLFCARDRFGEKPFYFYNNDQEFAFASEIKALWARGIEKLSNEKLVFNYLFFNNLHNPNDLSETFYSNIHQIKPSHFIIIGKEGQILVNKKYWDLNINEIDYAISTEQASLLFTELLYNSVNKRLRSDVPVGSSLSGGLDSSSIVSIISSINKNSSNSAIQKTFSAKFPGFAKDESYFINLVRDRIESKNFDCFPSKTDFIENFDKIIQFHDEPFISASVFAQYEVMKLAKENNTKVILDGQGADEILCGYPGLVDSYFFEIRKKKEYSQIMREFRKTQISNVINNYKRRKVNYRLKSLLGNSNINILMLKKIQLLNLGCGMINSDYFHDMKIHKFSNKYIFDTLNDALYHSTMCGGLQDLLRFADRNSMANSIEVRLPFLSHNLVEFVFKLPSSMKVKLGFTKYVLRDSMSALLPEEITWRKDKIGYEPPQNDWIKDLEISNISKGINVNNNNFNKWNLLMLSKFDL